MSLGIGRVRKQQRKWDLSQFYALWVQNHWMYYSQSRIRKKQETVLAFFSCLGLSEPWDPSKPKCHCQRLHEASLGGRTSPLPQLPSQQRWNQCPLGRITPQAAGCLLRSVIFQAVLFASCHSCPHLSRPSRRTSLSLLNRLPSLPQRRFGFVGLPCFSFPSLCVPCPNA